MIENINTSALNCKPTFSESLNRRRNAKSNLLESKTSEFVATECSLAILGRTTKAAELNRFPPAKEGSLR